MFLYLMRKILTIFPKPPLHKFFSFSKISPSPASMCPSMSTTAAAARRSKKVIVIMGPTGSGKSKLSIDLASRFFPQSEIINSDKIQIYRGLDITTNKMPIADRKRVRHHLINEFDSSESHPEFTPSDFRSSASSIISQIISRRRIPFIVGGSNSYIYSLLAKKFNPDADVFDSDVDPETYCKELGYHCCFIWVDVSLPVLNQHLNKRVDDMLDSGMFEELKDYYQTQKSKTTPKCGLKKSIGVPEFEKYFKSVEAGDDVDKRGVYYEEAVKGIKDNTCQLAKRQREKIVRLRDGLGWDVRRVDATAAFRAAMGGGDVAEIWEREVVEPSVKIVKQFLDE